MNRKPISELTSVINSSISSIVWNGRYQPLAMMRALVQATKANIVVWAQHPHDAGRLIVHEAHVRDVLTLTFVLCASGAPKPLLTGCPSNESPPLASTFYSAMLLTHRTPHVSMLNIQTRGRAYEIHPPQDAVMDTLVFLQLPATRRPRRMHVGIGLLREFSSSW